MATIFQASFGTLAANEQSKISKAPKEKTSYSHFSAFGLFVDGNSRGTLVLQQENTMLFAEGVDSNENA